MQGGASPVPARPLSTDAAAARWRRLVPALWAGWLLCVALLATPAVFALLPAREAGRIAGRMLAEEAYSSLALGVAVLLLELRAARRAGEAGTGSRFGPGVVFALGTLFCTVAGYFALAPLMESARAGRGPFSFAALHGVSTVLYGVKCVLVFALAWRAAGG